MGRFEAVVNSHPPLLEAIFDVDMGDPGQLFYPEQIAILITFFRDVNWDEAHAHMQLLADLPVREKLTRGPLKNATLRRAVEACRAYWREEGAIIGPCHRLRFDRFGTKTTRDT